MPNPKSSDPNTREDESSDKLLSEMIDHLVDEELGVDPAHRSHQPRQPGDEEPDGESLEHTVNQQVVQDQGHTPELSQAFPVHIFGQHAEFLSQVAEQSRVPIEGPAMQMLGVLSAASQKRCCVSTPEGYLTTGLYIMISAESGDGKSRSQDTIARPLRAAQTRMIADAKREAIPVVTRRRILQRQVGRLERQAADTDDVAVREALERQINLARENLVSLVPRHPRLFTGDTTMERLLTLMHDNSQVMFFLTDEGSRLFEMMRYYDPILQAYNGKPLDQSRLSRSDLILDEPSLAILVAVQPTVLSGLVANRQNVERGLLARFLYLVADANRQRRTGASFRIDEDLADAYENRLLTLLGNPVKHGVGTRNGPVEFVVVGDTLRTWEAFNADIIKRSETGDLHPIRRWAVRAPENALKVAGILHAWRFVDFNRAPGDISTETMGHAIELMTYLLPHARRAFSAEVLHFGEVAQKIFNWFSKSRDVRRDCGFLYEQVLRAFVGRHNTVEVRAGIDALISEGYIARVANEGSTAERFRVTRWH